MVQFHKKAAPSVNYYKGIIAV